MTDLWLLSYVVLWLVVLFEGALIFVLLRELGVRALKTAEAISHDGLEIDELVPAVTVEDRDGRARVLAPDQRPLVVIFGSRHCEPCRALAPVLNRFAAKHRELDFVFVVDDAAASVGAVVDDLKLTTPVLGRPGVMADYRVRVTPFGFLVDGGGHVRSKGLVSGEAGLRSLVRRAGLGTHRPAQHRSAVRKEEVIS